MKNSQVSKTNKVIQIIVNVIIWVLLVMSAIITIMVFSSQSNDGVPKLFGKIPVTILSDSMAPTFVSGDMIIAKEVSDIASLKSGDVITFWTTIENQKVLNTHKIVDVKEQNGSKSFVTKGDANSVNDEKEVYPSDIVGVYTGTKIPVLGNAINFLKSSAGFLFCIVLPLLLFFLYQVYQFVIAIIEMKQNKSRPQIDEEEIKRKAIEEYLASQENKDDDSQNDQVNKIETLKQ